MLTDLDFGCLEFSFVCRQPVELYLVYSMCIKDQQGKDSCHDVMIFRCFSLFKDCIKKISIILFWKVLANIIFIIIIKLYFSSLARAILISSQRQDISLIWSAVSSDSHLSKTVLQISTALYSTAQYG